MIPSITEKQIFTALGNFLQVILPQLAGKVVVGQTNRVASPEGDYIEMWALSRPRLGTNVETPEDTKFTASIAPLDATTSTMTVTAVDTGLIEQGNQVFAVGVANNTAVQSQIDGPTGGAGHYVVSNAQTVGAGIMSAGTMSIETSTEFIAQLDVHGPNSGDNATVISNTFRSAYAVDQLDGTGVTPLYSDDPRQAPFITAASQYEDRWTVDVHMQFKPSVSTPQEFYDAVDLTVVNVDVAFPD